MPETSENNRARQPRSRRSEPDPLTAIRDAAARVFERKGFERSTLADIADELGRPHGSIHYHIASKQDLLFDILSSSWQELNDEVTKVAAYPLPAVDRLRLVLREHVRNVVDPAHSYSATATEREIAALKPEHLEIVSDRRRQYRALIYSLIEEAQEAGAIQVQNTTVAARAILSMIVQLPRWYRAEGSLKPDQLSDLLWELIMHGLRGSAGQSQGQGQGARRRVDQRGH